MKELYDIIIIGGGPGGVASAVEASIFGLKNILLIEKGENHSQTIRHYYKDAKRVDKDWKGQEVNIKGNVEFFDGTKESTLSYFDTLLDDEKIDTLFKTEVFGVTKENDLLEVSTSAGNYKAKNVIVAIGRMGKPNRPSYKLPGSIRNRINFNARDCRGNEKILVVGGGDSAIEYACHLCADNIVTLSYRRDSFSRANDINRDMITQYDQEEKLRVRYSIDIDSIENSEGNVQVNYSNGYHTIYDRVIYALGGTTPVEFLKSCNIELDSNNEPIFTPAHETSVPGLYMVGDIVFNSGGSIAMAINHAHDVLEDITGK